MKKLRKIIAVMTAFLMITTSSYAAGVSFTNPIAGETDVSIDVTLDAVPADIQDVSAITIRYEYDESKLEYISTVSTVYTTVAATSGNIIWYDPFSLTDTTQKITNEKLAETNGKLFTINFKRIDGAYGNVNVEITYLKLTDSTFASSQEATANSGIIDLGEAKEETDGDNTEGKNPGEDQGGSGTDNGNEGVTPDNGKEDGDGTDTEDGKEDGNGTGTEDGKEDGNGTGTEDGKEDGNGAGTEDGSGSGSGSDSGSGSGSDSGSGSSSGKGSGNSSGKGSGSSSGSGSGSVVITPPATTTTPSTENTTPSFSGFADLSSDNWAYPYAEALMNKGIISGDGSATPSIRPDDNITREEAAKIALLAMGVEPEEGTELAFADSSDISDWAKPYIATAVKHGVISGYDDNSVRPKNNITREEMLTILARAMKWQVEETELTFADSIEVSSWAAANIAYAVQLGVMNGYEDNTIRPGATITRAETFALVSRCIN